ncbi:MAG TPA: aminotransferase class IV [Gemmataceae bacterium]|nr:aminotransferase class IV [Gemmataceae bacterium]
MSLAYFNGRFVPVGQIALPLDDAGLVWGATVTDRLRTFNGHLFALDAHLRRFYQSCELARIPQLIPNAQLGRISERLVRDNRQGGEMSAIWIATPGPVSGAEVNPSPTLIAYTSPLDLRPFARQSREGARLFPMSAGLGVDPRVKHRSRLPWWIARQQILTHDPLSEPLFVETGSDAVLETPTANVLAVLDGTVVSPPRSRILGGVSLGVVEDLCRQLGLPFAEHPITLPDLARAAEVLLANTTYCLAGVSRIADWPVPFPGPILNRLLDAWSKCVGVDIRGDMAG